MAGTSKSYFRKAFATSEAQTYTVAHPDGLGTMTIIPQFLYNPSGETAMTNVGACSANTGNAEYFAQEGNSGEFNTTSGGYEGGTCDAGNPGGGPEENMGGAQENHLPFTDVSGYHDCS
jgi:hypothetical protein